MKEVEGRMWTIVCVERFERGAKELEKSGWKIYYVGQCIKWGKRDQEESLHLAWVFFPHLLLVFTD